MKGLVEWKTELVARMERGLAPAAATTPATAAASSEVEDGSKTASA